MEIQPDSLIPTDFQRLVLIVLMFVFYLAFSFVTRDGQYSSWTSLVKDCYHATLWKLLIPPSIVINIYAVVLLE